MLEFTLLYILFCGLSSLSAANQEMNVCLSEETNFLKGQARILAYSFLKLVSEVKPAGDFL